MYILKQKSLATHHIYAYIVFIIEIHVKIKRKDHATVCGTLAPRLVEKERLQS